MSYVDDIAKMIRHSKAVASAGAGGGTKQQIEERTKAGTRENLQSQVQGVQKNYEKKYSGKSFQELQTTLDGMEDGFEKSWLSKNAPGMESWRKSIRDVGTLQQEITGLTQKLENRRAQNNLSHRRMLRAAGISDTMLPHFFAPDGEEEAAMQKQLDHLQEEYEWSAYFREQEVMEHIDEYVADAEAEYQSYIQSEEYAAWKMAKDRAVTQNNDLMARTGLPAGIPGAWEENEKEKNLRVNLEYYKSLQASKNDKQMMEADLEELSSWPEADQQALMLYISNRNRDAYNPELQGLYGMQNAQEEAAPLIQKYGIQKVNELAESYLRSQTKQLTQDVAASAQEAADQGFWAGAGHSALSVGANLLGSMTSPLGYLVEGAQQTGRYSTLDPNNVGMIPGVYAGAVRGKVGENIKGSWAGDAGATVYEAGMSALDNLARTVATGGGAGSLALAATGSFGQTVSDLSEKGASPMEAVGMGIINGGLEVLTEKISLDNLLKELDTPKNAGEVLKAMLRAGGVEVTEEELSFLGSTLAEAAVLREKSSYNRRVAELQVYGLTENQAREQAARGVIDEAFQTGLQSFLSGGMMSGATSAYSYTMNRLQNRAAEKQLQKTAQQAAQQIQQPDTTQQRADPSVMLEPGVTVSQEKIQAAERISRSTGRQIIFYSSEDPNDGNGFYSDDGVIHVNDKGADPVAQIISHELTHSVEMADAYKELSSLVLKHIQQKGGDLQQLRSEKRNLYAQAGHPLKNDADVDSEIVAAHVAEYLLTDEQSITSLVQENRSLGQKIRDLLDQLLAKLGNSSAQERAFIKQARDAYARALDQTGAVVARQTEAGNENTTSSESAGMTVEDTLEWGRNMFASGEWTEEEFDKFMDAYQEWEEQQGVDGMAAEDQRFAERKYSFAGERSQTAGEIEAKDTAKRRSLDDKGRKNAPPDLGDGDTVFVDDESIADSLDVRNQEQKNNRKYSISEAREGYKGKNLADSSEVYTYDYLVSMPDMKIKTLPDVDAVRSSDKRVDTAKVIEMGMENALSIGEERGGKIYVKNRYTGRELRVDVSSIRHGLNGDMNRILTNARLGSVIGDVIHNAIPINALHNTAEGVEGTYAMAGYAVDDKGREFVAIITVEQRSGAISGIDTYDVTHAVSGRQKRSKQADTKSQGVYPSMLASEISISDLLFAVKETYQSILPNDVLSHFDETKNRDGYYYGRAKFSISDSSVSKRDVARQLQAIIDRGGDTADLQQYVRSLQGGVSNRGRYTEERGSSGARQILQEARQQGIGVEEYLRQNWERYDSDGEWNAEAREALRKEGGNRRRYSISDTDSEGNKLTVEQQKYFSESMARDATGKLLVLYHQTDADFTVFDTRHHGAGSSDNKTPFGIFLKRSPRDIGMRGKKQMMLYANITNPIYASNREDLVRQLRRISDDYNEILKEIESLNVEYESKLERARKTLQDFMVNWRKENKDASRKALYDVLEFNTLSDAEDQIVDEWTAKDDELSARAKEIITAAIRSAGYDGVFLENDDGSWGRKTDAIIALEPSQVKNVSNTSPTSNPDIRYSISEKDTNIVLDVEQQLKDGATNVYGYELAGFDEGEPGVRNPSVMIRKPGETGKPTSYELSVGINTEDAIIHRAAEIIAQDYQASQDMQERPESQTPAKTPEEIRASLPAKARIYLQRAGSTLLNTIGEKMNVPKFASREHLKGIVQEISNEYLVNGTVSAEKADLLFDKAYAQGVIVDKAFYDEYKDIKTYLRKTGVTISERDQADIADFQDFRRRAFGTLSIKKEGGLPVDSAYHELNTMAPELFPESITHPADQLQRMFDVGRSIEISQKTLDEYYGDGRDDFRAWARNDFDSAIGEIIKELKQVKRVAEEQEAKASERVEITEEEAADLYRELKAARRNYEKVNAKNILTDHDDMQVGRLLRGEIQLEHLDPGKDFVKGIKAVYEAKQEYERISKKLAAYKRQQKAKHMQRADDLLQTADTWKDKKTGIAYSRETMRRNVLDIIKDEEIAQAVLKEYFEPVQISEAMATRFKTEYRDKVRDLDLSQKVQKGNLVSEAHAVQLLGEAMDNIRVIEASRGRMKNRDGKSLYEWRDVINNLWFENPGLDKAKIEEAVEEFRKIYDDLFQKMNKVRIRNGYEPVNYRQGYFPHFQPGDGDGILVHFGKAMGIDTGVETLPTTINGMTQNFKPGIQWFGNAQERLGFATAYDAVQGFDKYIEGVSNVIFHTENIQKLRAFASQARYRTSDEGIKQQVDAIQADDRLTMEEKQMKIRDIYEHGKFTLSNFVVELDEYTNLLAGKKSKYDRTMEAMMGRRAYTIMKNWESRVGANMIAGNVTSAMTNFIPLTQAGARLDRGLILKGMLDTLNGIRRNDGFAGASDFLTNRRGSDALVQTWGQKAAAFLGTPMELIDNFTSEAIVRAAYEQNLRWGLSEKEAMHQADLFAAGVMADRSKGAMPTLLESKNPLFKAFTQFQLEVNNQYSEIFKDLPREYRESGAGAFALMLLKYFLGAFMYNEIYEYFIGRRPALDPIGMLNRTIGDLTGYELPNLVELGVNTLKGEDTSFETEKVGLGEAGTTLAGEMLGNLPFSAGLTLLGVETDGGRIPAASAIPDLSALWDAATGDMTPQQRWKEIQDELNKLAYVIPPFGGNQISKIWKGVKAYTKGGSYSMNKEGEEILQYPVYKDEPGDAFWNMVRATLMGKNSLPTAQQWTNNGFDSLNAEQTAVYQDMQEAGVKDREAYALINALRNADVPAGIPNDDRAEKLREIQSGLIQNADISDEGKTIAYYGLVATDQEKQLMDQLADNGADQSGLAEFMIGYKQTSALKGAEKRYALYDAVSTSSLTEEDKITVVGDILGTELTTEKGNPSQYAKFLSAVEDGLGVDQYMKMYSRGTDIDDYFDMRDRGLSVQNATDISLKLTALTPLPGKDKVSWTQQCEVIAESGMSSAEKVAALEVVSKESTGKKIRIGYENGVDPDIYVDLQKVLPQFDADNSGGYSQKEVTAAIDAMAAGDKSVAAYITGTVREGVDLSNDQKAVLWQLMTNAKEGRKNPYDKDIGKYIYDLVQGVKEDE